jgi:hypothetical protein
MNDPKIYGPVLYSLPIRTAIEAGIIDDYRIVVALASQQDTEEFREQAIRIAIDRAMQEYGIRKVFTFHALVADAGGFVLGATDTLKDVRLYHVNGNQSRAERELKLEGFANAERALMSNARCLTEGVDLPAADMVAFLSPKRNPIDIVQAIGRVLRKHGSKKRGGFVFLPVFVKDGQDEETAIAESNWAGVYEVLQELREQDELMTAAMSKCARGDGDLPDKILILDTRKGRDGTEADRRELSEGMRRAIRVKLMRPFRIDPDGKDAELIRMAMKASPCPDSRTPLGSRLSKLRGTPEHETTQRLLQLREDWFPALIAKQWEDRLVALAQTGCPRPDRNTPEGVHLRMYTCESQRGSFRPELRAKIKRIAHHWWVGKAFDRQEQGLSPKPLPKWRKDKAGKMRALERLAIAGGKKPVSTSKEGKNLCNYTRPESSAYDPDWTERIRRLAPHWFRHKKHGASATQAGA